MLADQFLHLVSSRVAFYEYSYVYDEALCSINVYEFLLSDPSISELSCHFIILIVWQQKRSESGGDEPQGPSARLVNKSFLFLFLRICIVYIVYIP